MVLAHTNELGELLNKKLSERQDQIGPAELTLQPDGLTPDLYYLRVFVHNADLPTITHIAAVASEVERKYAGVALVLDVSSFSEMAEAAV